MHKKVIFIGGSSYSGSTLLDMMISSGNGGFSLGEVNAYFYPYRSHHINPICGCGDPTCTIWPKLKSKGSSKLYREIFKQNPTVSYIVDSSKDLGWIAKQTRLLKRCGIPVYHILIWKTPLEFAYSKYKRGDLNNWETMWKNYHKLYIRKIDNWFSVKYSELAMKPQNIIKKICNEIGINYFDGKENYWEFEHHTLFGNSSAKIHLYKKDSSTYNNHKKELNETINRRYSSESPHQSIYFKDDFLKKLPEDVINSVSNDLEFPIIMNFLESRSILKKQNCIINDLDPRITISLHKYISMLVHSKFTRAVDRIRLIRLIINQNFQLPFSRL